MVRDYAFNLHVDPVRTEMSGTQQITISQIYSSDERKAKGIIADEKLSQVCFTDKIKPERVIENGTSTDNSESESFQ